MRRPDLGAVIAGLVLAAVGVTALAAGDSSFASALRWVWPLVLIAIGLALLTARPNGNGGRPSPRHRRSAGEHGPSHQVGTEGGEDGEVQKPGRRHHRGVGPLP
jgi:hypothetical protein